MPEAVENLWNGMHQKGRMKVLQRIFPELSSRDVEELSVLNFDDLPNKHPATKKSIAGSLILAYNEDGFSPEEEKQCRDLLANE